MLANIARQSVRKAGNWSNTKCWHFTDGYIYKEYDVVEPVFPASNNFTYSYWIYIISTGSGGWARYLLYLEANKTSGSKLQLVGTSYHRRYSGDQYLFFRRNNTGNGSGALVPTNQWINITITGTNASSNALKIYFNGIEGYSGASGLNDFGMSNVVAPFTFQVGSHSQAPDFYIAELGVWNVALDADAVAVIGEKSIDWNTNSGNYDNANNLVAYYKFGNGTGDNPASLLHDETNGDHVSESAGFRDLTSVVGTIDEVDTDSVGNGIPV